MKNILIILITITLLGSCVSVKKYNRNLNVVRNEKQLKSDVDYIYKKLQRLHPRLYWYINKEDLDFKFDSLKSTINAPMTSNDFYLKISPVIASIKQGHTQIFPLYKKMKIKKEFALLKTGTSPLAHFDFDIFDNELYIIKNNSDDKSIKIGTEVITVNNISPQELLSKYCSTFSSDGFNQTFINKRLSKYFPIYFYYQNDLTDSVLCQLKYNDTIRSVCLKRNTVGGSTKKEKTQIDFEKKKDKEENKKKSSLGYDELSRTYSKTLNFFEPDSSIAVMKINNFSKGYYVRFYQNSFKKLNSLKTKTLILDLRDNSGGNLKDAMELYSYLVDSDFYFIDKSEVVSKTSVLHTNYFRGNPLYVKAILAVFSPIRLVKMIITSFKVKKGADNKYYYSWSGSKLGHPKPNNFKSTLYVLINGGSFSASCILSSNLKGCKRGVFVGEETGGAFNGTVAGKMTFFNLPKSKLSIVFGLTLIQPYFKTDLEGRGIFPDVEIKPTLEDWIYGNDPELKWVLDKIKSQHTNE
jgi:C-terminal processing protease CtpA/Prc